MTSYNLVSFDVSNAGTTVVVEAPVASSNVIVQVGTSDQRPTAIQGMIRYNTTLNCFEGYNGTTWISLSPIGITNLTDVLLSNPQIGDMLTYNGSKWINSESNAIITNP